MEIDVCVSERLHGLIDRELGVDVPTVDTDLFESGLIDSLALVSLIVAIEDSFACEVPLEELDLDHFRSISVMAAFVTSTLGVQVQH